MRYVHHIPSPPISEFVELLWFFEYVAPHASERLLPTGSVELVINLSEDADRSFDGIVAGPYTRFFVLDTRRPISVVGVHFKPGGAFPFLPLPLQELRNHHVPLQFLWGPRADELRERLLATKTAREKLRLLDDTLLAMLNQSNPRHPAIAYALATFNLGGRRVGDVVDKIGMSQRYFIELFSQEVGLTPKTFCRVRRFQRAVSLLHRAADVDWADTAVACSYCDQSHMIHDFQDFAGLSPAHYLARRSAHVNHLPQETPHSGVG
jgi:AraC-like DNA-binding protein